MSRVALVTGASRGLGAAIATALAEQGSHVAVNYFASPEKAERLCADLQARGFVAEAFQADVREEESVAKLIRAVEAKLGPVEILVPNATGPQPFLSIEEQTWRAHLDQLEFFVKSPLILLKEVLQGMKQRKWGRVINIGSEVVELGNPRFANYVAAKGAQLALTRSWATELAPSGITVNLVAPGWIPTERHDGTSLDEQRLYTAGVPMQHMGVPRDVGEAVTFLASEAAKFITGQKIAVNGGNTLE